MSNLPCEILDRIVDLLHDNHVSLRNCCLVSKSWIARTRTHLFAEVVFQTAKGLESWKKKFLDPSTSPAHYTKALFIGGPTVVTTVDVEAGSWIRGFSRVVCLGMVGQYPPSYGWGAAFAQFHGLLPSVKSLRMKNIAFPPSQLSSLILSFPLLENLSVVDSYRVPADKGLYINGVSTAIQPSSLPTFTGSLELLVVGIGCITNRWIFLPGGIRFRKLTLMWFCDEDISSTAALVEKCSHTLESLDITRDSSCGTFIRHLHLHRSNLLLFPADPKSASFSLSKATKLGDVIFRPGSLAVEWISRALQAITSEHRDLRRISVDVPHYSTLLQVGEDLRGGIGEGVLGQWLNLDHILVHLWESFSIRTDVIWAKWSWKGTVGDHVGSLLPEMTKRGMVTINLVK